jgi:hypothetical protein
MFEMPRCLLSVTGKPTEEDKPVNDYVKACAPDSPLAKGEKEPGELL